jgi:biopolymer transport protein ExbB
LEARLAGRSDLVSVAAAKAVSGGRGDWFRMRNLLAESLQDQAAALLRRIEWLNLIGNVSPMVGLFGTVYGMIMLFNAIVLAGGQPQTIQLADGISVALVTTFWGLLIAIPAVGIHGVFRNRIEALVNDAVVAAEGIMPEIKRGLERQQRAEAQRAGKADHRVEDYRDKSAQRIDEILPAR